MRPTSTTTSSSDCRRSPTVEGVPPERLHLAVEDGRRLSFPDDSFDKVYSLSVLEHIPDDGDSACVTEIARVLRPGGECYLTVPFWPQSRTDFVDGRRRLLDEALGGRRRRQGVLPAALQRGGPRSSG